MVNAAIVAYNRPQSLCALVLSLAGQSFPVQRIVIVDNSANNAVKDAVAALPGRDKIAYRKMKDNTGSAGGFYQAIKDAYGDCSHVWVFDDDMNVATDALEKLLDVLPVLDGDGKLGALRCSYQGNNETQPAAVKSFAWRGTLLSVKAIGKIGLPDPGYFLYGEDVDYSWRMRNAGYSMYYVPQSIMSVNSRTTKLTGRFFGRTVEFHQSPYRLYYAVRNELHVHLTFYSPAGVIKTLGHVIKLLWVIAGNKNIDRKAFVAALAKGVVHGVAGKRGKTPGYTHETESLIN